MVKKQRGEFFLIKSKLIINNNEGQCSVLQNGDRKYRYRKMNLDSSTLSYTTLQLVLKLVEQPQKIGLLDVHSVLQLNPQSFLKFSVLKDRLMSRMIALVRTSGRSQSVLPEPSVPFGPEVQSNKVQGIQEQASRWGLCEFSTCFNKVSHPEV